MGNWKLHKMKTAAHSNRTEVMMVNSLKQIKGNCAINVSEVNG